MSTNNDLVLITGVSGHVGFGVLREALAKGYNVRAVVRSEAKAKLVGENAALKGLKTDSNLSFYQVSDFPDPQAFATGALKDVVYVIHIASPQAIKGSFTEGDLDAEVVQPAWRSTLSLLKAAANTPSVKRIVITSSGAAVTPVTAFSGDTSSSDNIVCVDERLDEIPPPYPNRIVAYTASKIAALNRAEAYVKETKPGYDVIHLHPSIVLGWDYLSQTEQDVNGTTNRFVTMHACGNLDEDIPIRTNNICSLDQVALVHVASLDKAKVKGNQSFVISNNGDDGMEYNQINGIMKKHFPKAVEKGIFKDGADATTVPLRIDVSKTEKTFRFRHAGFEECVVDVLSGYLRMRGEVVG